MYLALLRYPVELGDAFHAAQSLRSLCPANLGELPAPATAVPFVPPANWTRSTNTHSSFPEYTVLGGWYHVAGASYTIEEMHMLSLSDVSEYTTPEQMADAWKSEMKQSFRGLRVLGDRAVKLCAGADAWFTSFQTQDRSGRRHSIDNVYAYGSDTLYVLQYASVTGTKDPSADKALRSLCPRQTPDGT